MLCYAGRWVCDEKQDEIGRTRYGYRYPKNDERRKKTVGQNTTGLLFTFGTNKQTRQAKIRRGARFGVARAGSDRIGSDLRPLDAAEPIFNLLHALRPLHASRLGITPIEQGIEAIHLRRLRKRRGPRPARPTDTRQWGRVLIIVDVRLICIGEIILIPLGVGPHIADGDGPCAGQTTGFIVELRDAGFPGRGEDGLRAGLLVEVVAVFGGAVGPGRGLGDPGRVEADGFEVVHAPGLVEGALVVAALVEAVEVVDAAVVAELGDLRARPVGFASGACHVIFEVDVGDEDFRFLPECVDAAGHELEFEVGGC